MNEIQDIVQGIVKGCARGGVEVTEILAAFTARTIIEDNEKQFVLDRNVTVESAELVIIASIDKLLVRDNPSLETIKMQVDFDSLFISHEQESQRIIQTRSKMIENHKNGIISTTLTDLNDFTTLTTLYRKIFKFLIEYCPNVKSIHDREIDREVAAALESVFPRVGLKSFIELNNEEKLWQLKELASIILGIRLFNRDQNRGGVGLDHMEQESVNLVLAMSQEFLDETAFFTDACQKYQYAIVNAYLHKKRYESQVRLVENLRNPEYEELFSVDTARISVPASIDDVGSTEHSGEERFQSHRTQLAIEEEILSRMSQPLPDVVLNRWLQELTNRRQYLSNLKILQEDVNVLRDKITSIAENIDLELRNLKALVSNRSSVPKEVVYPRFDALGSLWVKLYEEVALLIARNNTYKTLSKYRLSFNPTLSEEYYKTDNNSDTAPSLVELAEIQARTKEATQQPTKTKASKSAVQATATAESTDTSTFIAPDQTNELKVIVESSNPTESESKPNVQTDSTQEIKPENVSKLTTQVATPSTKTNAIPTLDTASEVSTTITRDDYSTAQTPLGTKNSNFNQQLSPAFRPPPNSNILELPQDSQISIEPNVINSSGATLLSIENTPDFILLPLELQGYCPWTIVHARGLLVPGRPDIGVIRYNNQYFVFDNDVGMKAFVADPEFYLIKVKEKAMKSPEYIHLLRLQKWFPRAAINRLLNKDSTVTNSSAGSILSLTKANMVDASTSTPTHIIESYIDINYHWNEWELRRKALKVINLKGCITTSSQTDASHFKRDNNTQVYLPKENDTQTRRDRGTNPPKVTSFVAGLRGKVSSAADGKDISKYMKVLSSIEEKSNQSSAEPGSRAAVYEKYRLQTEETRQHVVVFKTDI